MDEHEMIFFSVMLQLFEDCDPKLEFLSPSVKYYLEEVSNKLEGVRQDQVAYNKIKYFANIVLEEKNEKLH